jgi:GT2 family glycosyltransferase
MKRENKNPLEVFKYGKLLVLYWERSEKLRSEIEVECNGFRLSKPLLGIEFLTAPSYLICGMIDKIPGLSKGMEVKLLGNDGIELANAKIKKPSGLREALVKSWDLVDRIRVEKGLLQNTRKIFTNLSQKDWLKILDSLTLYPLIHEWSPDQSIHYIRLQWQNVAHPGLMDVTLHGLDLQGNEIFDENLSALVENQAIHFFSHKLGKQESGKELYCIIEAGRERYVPAMIKLTSEKTIGIPNDTWLQQYLTLGATHNEALKGYATLELQNLLKQQDAKETKSNLKGRIDANLNQLNEITGWVTDIENPQFPFMVQILVDGDVVGETLCDLPRPNGLSNGFAWTLPTNLLNGERHEISLRCARSHSVILNNPYVVGADHYDVDIRLNKFGEIIGWVKERCINSRIPYIGLVVDGESFAGREIYKAFGQDLYTWQEEASGKMCFRIKCPSHLFDTKMHQIQLQAYSRSKNTWNNIGEAFPIQAYYEGRLERVDLGLVSGWIINKICPQCPVEIDVLINEKAVARGYTNCPWESEELGHHRFDIGWVIPHVQDQTAVIEIRLAANPLLTFGKKTLQTNYLPVINALKVLSSILNDRSMLEAHGKSNALDENTAYWIRSELFREIIKNLRHNRSIPHNPKLVLTSKITLPSVISKTAVVDVIVPVYGSRTLVMECLLSVLDAKNELQSELIVIDDASPDPELIAELRRMSKQCSFTFIENTTNLGFPGTANRGMRIHEDRDVVLLNSDTKVASGWLDRLSRAAYSAANIGTVTPLSNNATICSYPELCKINPIPIDQTVHSLDQICLSVNSGVTVELPTAVGFCMYIRRDVLNETGYFDEVRWGKGYGEENEFCLRASEVGWRHVSACDVFVAHEGEGSFGDSSHENIRNNTKKLDELYPEYSILVQQFIRNDPLRYARRNISLELLKRKQTPRMLFVLHNLGGGVRRAANDLADKLFEKGIGVLELISNTQKEWSINCHDFPYRLQYNVDEFDAMLRDLLEMNIRHIHYHQTMHFPNRIWTLPKELGVNYDFTVHDYFVICPRISMVDETGTHCGENQFNAELCDGCVRIADLDHRMVNKYKEFDSNVARWREFHDSYLRQARRVFAPSKDSAERIMSHFDLSNIVVKPNLEDKQYIKPSTIEQDSHTILLIGGIGDHKGYQLLSKCVQNAAKRNLDITFMVIGYTCNDEYLLSFGNVCITGEYKSSDLPKIIKSSRAKLALFLSQTPETYSYALSEAWANRLFPIALDRGAIAERIRMSGYGLLLPVDILPESLNNVLIEELGHDHSDMDGNAIMEWGDNMDVLHDYYDLPHDFWQLNLK